MSDTESIVVPRLALHHLKQRPTTHKISTSFREQPMESILED